MSQVRGVIIGLLTLFNLFVASMFSMFLSTEVYGMFSPLAVAILFTFMFIMLQVQVVTVFAHSGSSESLFRELD